MKTYEECIPCFLRQAGEASKLAGLPPDTEKLIIGEVSKMLSGISRGLTPPEIARIAYGIVDKYTGGTDVYERIKRKSNSMAMELYPHLKARLETSKNRLLDTVRLAVAGNVIDYGVPRSFDIETEIEECLEKDFAVFDFEEFTDDLASAKNILYMLDNAGEIVFDRMLIEEIRSNVIAVVRGKPIINDVTLRDAVDTGLTDICEVITSGSDIPGTLITETSGEFRAIYDMSDMVISKGQGNYETLSAEKKNIYFIFKAKCAVVASHLGCREGDILLKKQRF